MEQYPEPWSERTPERYRPGPPATFGLARDAERLLQQPAPSDEPEPDEPPRKPRRERGPFVTYLCLPWSYGDHTSSADVWRRLRCRRGRHQVGGGHIMQVGGTEVFVEPRCRWCGATVAS